METNDQHWYQQPVAWLAVAIFVVTVAGCIHLVVFALAHQDPPLVMADKEASFKIPATRKPIQIPDAPPPDTP